VRRYPSGAPCLTGGSLAKVVVTVGNDTSLVLYGNLLGGGGGSTKFFSHHYYWVTALVEIKLSTVSVELWCLYSLTVTVTEGVESEG
jgi:hypothetical protein